jgi:hypothetical protein
MSLRFRVLRSAAAAHSCLFAVRFLLRHFFSDEVSYPRRLTIRVKCVSGLRYFAILLGEHLMHERDGNRPFPNG